MVTVAGELRNGRTVYRLRMPVSELYPLTIPQNGTVRFSLLVNNNDGNGRAYYREWASGIGGAKSPTEYGDLTVWQSPRNLLKGCRFRPFRAKADQRLAMRKNGCRVDAGAIGDRDAAGVSVSVGNLLPNSSCRLTFRARGTARIEVVCFANKQRINLLKRTALKSDWQEFSMVLTVPEGVKSVSLNFFAWEQRLRQRLWAALHYPLIVSVVMALLIGALARYVLPVFTPFLEGQRSHLPWCSRLFLELLTLCNGPLWIVLSLLGGLGAAWAYYLYIYHPQGRYQLQHLILTIPLLGEAVRHLVLSRFCRTLALLLNSGLSLERALPIVGGALAHHPLALALEGVEAELKEGSELEGALRAEEFFANQGALVGAMRVAQETGRLPTILEDWSRLLAQRGELQLETLSQLLEPLLVAFLGGVMGFILVSLFAPLYSLLSQGLS